MTDPNRPLSLDDVRQITQLIETLEKSSLDFLQVEVGDLKVTLGKGEPPAAAVDYAAPPTAAAPAAEPARPSAVSDTPAPAAQSTVPSTAPAADGTIAITAPMLGRFYAQSEPGADPFVAVGMDVAEDTTVALIEVMKMFTNIPAGISGTITEVCVRNEDMVEYGQVLFRVRPAAGAA